METKKKKIKDLPTVAKKKKYKTTYYSLKATSYASGVVPAVVITSINAKEWFNVETKLSVSFGFVALLVAVITTLISAIKKDNSIAKNFGSLIVVGLNALIWACALLLLSSIFQEIAFMLLYTAIGIFTGGILDTYNEKSIKKELEYYEKLCVDNGLTKKSNNHEIAERQAKVDKEIAKGIW